MKTNQKGKMLSLKKSAISKLNSDKMNQIIGGNEEPVFTSIFNCSKGGFTCQCETFACHFTDHCTAPKTV